MLLTLGLEMLDKPACKSIQPKKSNTFPSEFLQKLFP